MAAGRKFRRDQHTVAYRVLDSVDLAQAIRIRETVLEAIAHDTISAEQRGRESRGFLAGRVLYGTCGTGRTLISIDAFVPLAGSCQAGPLFNYSECDKDEFCEQIRETRIGRRVVGMVRSNHRGAGISKDDSDLMKTHFQEDGVFLLIENHGELSGTFYLSGAAGFGSVYPSYTFLLRSNARTSNVPLMRDEVDLRQSRPPKQDRSVGRSSAKSYTIALICSVISVLMAVAGFEFHSMVQDRNRSSLEPVSIAELPIQLKAEREGSGNEWRVSWNRRAKAVLAAEKGRLTIGEGAVDRQVDLTSAELQTGSIVFTPLSDDVRIRLEVRERTTARSMSEVIRVLGTSLAGSVNAGSVGLGELSDISHLLKGREEFRGKTSALSPITPQKKQEPEGAVRVAKNLRPFSQPPASLVTVGRSMNDLPVAPEVRAPASAPIFTVDSIKPVTSIGEPPLAVDDAVSRSEGRQPKAQQNSGSARQSPASNSTASGSSPQLPLKEAVLLRRTEPQFPKLALKGSPPVVVRIEATIGVDGRLHGIQVLSGPDTFRAAALKAISDWLYSPALLHGKPVESPTRIEVRFGAHP